MKRNFFKSSVKAQQISASSFVQAISQPKTKDNSLLIAQISTIGLIIVFAIVMMVVFNVPVFS